MNGIEKYIRVRLHLTKEMLGSQPGEKDVFSEYIAANAPDAMTMQEEIEAYGVADVEDKGRTIFLRDEQYRPILKDYQIRGFIKEKMKILGELTIKEPVEVNGKMKKKKIPRNETGKAGINKYNAQKIVDNLIFVKPEIIPIIFKGGTGDCQRPLRAETLQGPRVALASSDTVPAGATLEFTIRLEMPELEASVRECLDFGELNGLGQWRSGGKGTFLWEELDEAGNTIGGNYRRQAAAE